MTLIPNGYILGTFAMEYDADDEKGGPNDTAAADVAEKACHVDPEIDSYRWIQGDKSFYRDRRQDVAQEMEGN